jgi:uncharacterized protein YjbJ (UPF0337 family)
MPFASESRAVVDGIIRRRMSQGGDMHGTSDILQGKWHELKGSVKKQFGKLTDDDVLKMSGRREELNGALQKRYGYNKERADLEIDNWLRDYKYL